MFSIFMITSIFVLLLGSINVLAIEPVIETIKPDDVLFFVDIDGNTNIQKFGEQADMTINKFSKNDIGIFTTIPGNIGTATIRWINRGKTYIAKLTGGGTCGIIRFDVGRDCHEVRYIY